MVSSRSATASEGAGHIPSLDGIRAVAALLVFVSHAGLDDYIPGGFGVTVFFFLSGFLITTLLRREYEQSGTISLGRFYLRRVFRIIPPLYIVLLLLLFPAGWAGEHTPPSGLALGAQFAQLTNYYLLFVDHWVIPDSVPTWSLAVEEHFYLLFPLLLIALLRRASYRVTALVLGAVCACVLAWRLWLILVWHVPSDYTFLATDTRLDSLLYGCILGIGLSSLGKQPLLRWRTTSWVLVLLLAGAVLVASFLDRSEAFRATWRYSLQGLALMPIFFTAVARSHWPIYRWLESWPMRFLGLISYTFYLIHLRALRLAAYYVGGSHVLDAVLAFIASVAFAAAMYYLVERHLAAVRRRLHHLAAGAAFKGARVAGTSPPVS